MVQPRVECQSQECRKDVNHISVEGRRDRLASQTKSESKCISGLQRSWPSHSGH
jgi:hypothetical protein